HDNVASILWRYEDHPEVKAAKAHYEQQDENIRSTRKIDFNASCRVFLQGEETPLTSTQRDVKRLKEHLLEIRVSQLKQRMLQASRTRRQAIKAKKTLLKSLQQQDQDQQQPRRRQEDYNRFKTMNGPSARAPPPPPL
ncbi:hypothetical protein BGX28_002155, partial [Mortierella sp. GBA30]